MSRGTKISLAVCVIVVALLALYYGFLMPDDASGEVTFSDTPPAAPGEPDPDRLRPERPLDRPASSARPPEADPAGLLRGREGDFADSTGHRLDVSRDTPARSRQDPLAVHGVTPPAPIVSPFLPSYRPPSTPTIDPTVTPDRALSPTATVSRPSAPVDSFGSEYTEYRVKSGDTLSLIALRHLGAADAWPAIVDANPAVDPRRLQIGQRLRLPTRPGRTRPPATPTVTPRTHTVATGETLIVIAKTYYGSGDGWRSIYDANRSAIGPDPDTLAVGTRLVIPGS